MLLAADLSRARRREVVDKMAAAVILRRWLDAQADQEATDRRMNDKRHETRADRLPDHQRARADRAGGRRPHRLALRRHAGRHARTGKVEIEIPNGASAGDVADRLAKARASSATRPIFRLYAGQRGVAGRFKAGPLRDRRARDAAADPRDAGARAPPTSWSRSSIPEGKNLVEVAEILDAAGIAGKAELVAQGDRSGVRRRAGPAGRRRSRAICSPTPTGCARTRRRRAR